MTESPYFIPDDPTAERQKTLNRVCLAFFILMTVGFVLPNMIVLLLMLTVPSVSANGLPSWAEWLISYGSLYGVGAPLTLLLFRTVPTVTRKPRKIGPHFFSFAAITFFGMLVGSYIGTYLNSIISLLTGNRQGNEVNTMLTETPLLLISFISLVVAPVMEELFFRKILMDKFRPLGGWFSILTSGLFFGLFHGNFEQFFYAALIGCVFAFVYWQTGRIRYSMILHAMANFIGGIFPVMVQSVIPTEWLTNPDLTWGDLLRAPGYLLLLVLPNLLLYGFAIAGFVCLIIYGRAYIQTVKKADMPLSASYGLLARTPGFWLYFAVCFIMFILTVILPS